MSIKGFKGLLGSAHKEPTKFKELVTGDPHFMDAAKEGTGSIVVGEGDACVPTVFRYKWPHDIQDMVFTEDNPSGPITNSDLKLAGLLICCLAMEEVSSSLYHKY